MSNYNFPFVNLTIMSIYVDRGVSLKSFDEIRTDASKMRKERNIKIRNNAMIKSFIANRHKIAPLQNQLPICIREKEPIILTHGHTKSFNVSDITKVMYLCFYLPNKGNTVAQKRYRAWQLLIKCTTGQVSMIKY